MSDLISLIQKAKIEEIISKYIKIVDSSKADDLRCSCPFHLGDSNPSFSISPKKQVYFCFGCKASGNVLTFIEDIEKVDKFIAIQILKKHLNIEDEEVSLYALYDDISTLLIKELNSNIDQLIKLEPRLDVYDFESFKLGYFPPTLKLEKIYPNEIQRLIDLGLLYKKFENTNFEQYINFFTNRLMFPLINQNGIIGFSGRTLINNTAKYKNSAESQVFQKRRILYGLNLAKDAIVKNDQAVLVEGNWDVVGMHSVQFQNTIAPLGTALTIEQLTLLKRFTKNILLLFDGDIAGKKASMKSSILAENMGFQVWMVKLNDGLDPDSLLRTQGIDGINSLNFEPIDKFYQDFDKEEVLKIVKDLESINFLSQKFLSFFKIIPETIKKSNKTQNLYSKNIMNTSSITHLTLLVSAFPFLEQKLDDLYLNQIFDEKNKSNIIQNIFMNNPYENLKNPEVVFNQLLNKIRVENEKIKK